LAQIAEIENRGLVSRSKRIGRVFLERLAHLAGPSGIVVAVRGLGLLVGVEFTTANGEPATSFALQVVKKLLHRGFIVLPDGEHANVIGFAPPLIVAEEELESAATVLEEVVYEQRI
jgi:4-aminobutyrate aminotransferase-like enzyme